MDAKKAEQLAHLDEMAAETERECAPIFEKIDANCMANSRKVLKAFADAKVAYADFSEINGYGYYDAGRDKIEQIYAQVLGAEDALVRAQIMSGTHALTLTLFGLLKHGDTVVSISGEPYDSMRSVIGLVGNSRNSLMAHGVKYEEIPLVNDDFDLAAIRARFAKGGVRMAILQRSRGYSDRKSLTIAKIQAACAAIREVNSEAIIMADNCYGEFVELQEPTQVGADIIAGSLMKNPGGGIASTGGYIAGKKDLVAQVAENFSAPCIGKDLGSNLGQNLSFFKGIYLSPNAVKNSLRTMVFASRMLEKLGFDGVSPRYDEERTDIIQVVRLNTPENLVRFCAGIQHGCPVDSFAEPEPDDMPGYPHQEGMASGSFTQGSTIELSCDGPVTPPYSAFMQGGLTYEYGKIGIMTALAEMLAQ